MKQKTFLHHIIIARLLLSVASLHAALQRPQTELAVYDYTLKNHFNVSNKITDLDNLDEDDIPIDIKAIALAANNNRDKNAPAVNLLALVLKHKSKEDYAKYLFASSGLLKDKVAQKKAHEYGYRLVQAYPNHCMLGVLAFLHQAPDYDVHTIVVPENQPMCTNCHLIAMQFFNQKLPASKQGCHGHLFPKPAPSLACACFHSSRFTQQQRQLSTLIDHFSKPKPQRNDIPNNAFHRQSEILIPANGQCLYTSLLFGYLLPVITNQQEYTRRYKQLTGKEYIPFPAKMLATYAADINTLHANPQCKQLLTNFMTHMHLEKGKWGGKEEIQKVADYLHINIQEYVPNPENPTARVRSDLTTPQDTTITPATITIDIVRDNPLPQEAAHHPASVKTAYHQQHYRLLYPLSKLTKNNTAWKPTFEDDDDEKKEAPATNSFLKHTFNQQITSYNDPTQGFQNLSQNQKALTSCKKTYPKQKNKNTADTLLSLGKSHDKQGSYDVAIYYYQQALEILRALYKQQDTLDALFSYLIQQGISKSNVQQFQQWLERNNFDDEALLEDLQESEKNSNIAAYEPKVYALLKQWLLNQAPNTLDEPFHPAIADALAQQGNAYLHFGNVTKALQNHQKAYTIREFVYSNPAHPKRMASCNNLARLHLHQKQYRQALQILNKGIQTWKQHGTQTDPIIALTYRLRGFVYYNQANYASARQDHQTSLSIHKKLYGENLHPTMADDHYAIADTYAKEGKYKDKALPHYKKALEIREQIYHDMPYHPAISAAISAIGTAYAAIGESDQAIESHVKATRCQLQHFQKENKIDHALTLYVPTNASRAKALDNNKPKESQIFPLHPRIKQFIDHTNKAVLLLHGDAGAGKSLYCRFVENNLWTTYQENNKSIIPLFISLPALKDPIHHAVTETLTQYGWDDVTIQALKKQSYQQYSQRRQASDDDSKDDEKTDIPSKTPRLLVFLDGYDEINATKNLYETNQLAQWGAKVIIDCRTEYLDQLDNYRQYIQADAELYIRPFNPTQIDSYLDHLDATKQANETQKTTWHKDQYKAKFEEMPSLQALSASPFLLQLIVTALPHLPNRTQITRADIYKTFIEQWITKAVNRMKQEGMGNISIAACWQYGMEVAFFMFLHERVTMQASTNSLKEAELSKHFFAEANTLLRKALPLKQLSNTTSSFLHKSIQEYCAAQAILQSVAQLSPRSPNELTTYFAKKVKAYDPINNKNTLALNQKLLNAAPAIIHFLVDELAPTAQHPVWKEWLFAIIEASKKNPQVAIAAANSATILNAGGILLHDKDWAGICIPHALLDHAFLARTNLQGANLMDVSLRQAYLEDTQCQKANVHGIRFGEYPMLLHIHTVHRVSWSPDGTRLASASSKNVYIWDVASSNQLQQCTGHTDWVGGVSWSPDGKRLASASGDKSVRIWDVASGNQLQLCAGHTDLVTSVSWSPDGKRLASAGGEKCGAKDFSVRIWDAANGKQLQLCAGHTKRVNNVSWSPDSTRVASASWDNTVRIWDGSNGNLLQQCNGTAHVCWSPDGTRLASASDDNTIRTWDVATGKQLQKLTGHTESVNSVSWSLDGKRLASASDDNTIRIWDVASSEQLQQYTGHTSHVYCVSWSPNGKRLASASEDKSVRIWDVITSKSLQQCVGHISDVWSVSWSPDGKNLASTSRDKSVRIWNVDTGKQLQLCTGHTHIVYSVEWSPDGKRLASGSGDKSVRIWDKATGKQLQQCTGNKDDVNRVSWSPDGKRLASAGEDKSVRIWDGDTGKQLQQCIGHTSDVYCVSWSPNGKCLASAGEDRKVRIWDVATQEPLQKGAIDTYYVFSISWSPDSRLLAWSSSDKTVHIWDVANCKQLRQCIGHLDELRSVKWSPNGKYLVSAAEDNNIYIWDAATGSLLQKATGHTNHVYSVTWSPDGTHIASASIDKSVRIWEVSPDKSLKKTRIIKKAKVKRIISHNPFFTLTNANFTGAIGLSLAYKQLVQQRGGIVEGTIVCKAVCTGHTNAVMNVSWSPDSTRIASASEDKSVRIWDGDTGTLLEQYAGHTDSVYSVSWSPDGKRLASASWDKSVRTWEVATGKLLLQCGHRGAVCSVSWSPDGRRLASAGYDKSVRIWDGDTSYLLEICTGHTELVRSVSWSPDGKCLASASGDDSYGSANIDNNVRIWDGVTGKLLKLCAGHGSAVMSISWSPDGKRLASAGGDKWGAKDYGVRIWDVATGKQLQRWTGHTSPVNCVSWSPDGKYLASGSGDFYENDDFYGDNSDNSVRIWEVDTGKELQRCIRHTSAVMSVSWSPDGKHFASAGGGYYKDNDNSVYIWKVA